MPLVLLMLHVCAEALPAPAFAFARCRRFSADGYYDSRITPLFRYFAATAAGYAADTPPQSASHIAAIRRRHATPAFTLLHAAIGLRRYADFQIIFAAAITPAMITPFITLFASFICHLRAALRH